MNNPKEFSAGVVISACVFQAASVAGWNALDVLSAEGEKRKRGREEEERKRRGRGTEEEEKRKDLIRGRVNVLRLVEGRYKREERKHTV